MRSLPTIDEKNRKLSARFELNLKVLTLIKKNNSILNFQKWKLGPTLESQLCKKRFKNRCILTGRGSSISRIYRLSRIQFRGLGRSGFIPGLRNSSW